ncbi:MAG: hypothetical protein JSS37_02620 [Proteobacteria bacterium]|nr:hypothetical protein [Pseudomonadota bacterium]
MSWFSRLFRSPKSNPQDTLKSIPIVKFDPSLVTTTVKADIKKNMRLIPELNTSNFNRLYDIALESVSRGGKQHLLCKALKEIEGISSSRAAEITLSLHSKANSLIDRERSKSIGIKHAVWMYSGVPCMLNPKSPTKAELRQDKAHSSANGKRYKIDKGLLLDGKWTWPGVEDGCKCSSRAVLSEN